MAAHKNKLVYIYREGSTLYLSSKSILLKINHTITQSQVVLLN